MYGRSFLQSRQVIEGAIWIDEVRDVRALIAWHLPQIIAFGNEEATEEIKYSGTTVPLHRKEHPEVLQEIQRHLEDKLHTTFNHCMLNRYDDGAVYIGSHSDNLGRCGGIVNMFPSGRGSLTDR